MAKRQREKSDYAVISLRIKEPLRAKIERAAKESGSSMNSEITARLEVSFAEDEHSDRNMFNAFGGAEEYALFRMAAAAADTVVAREGKKWPHDPQVFDSALRAINVVLEAFRPKGRKKPISALVDVRAALLLATGLGQTHGFSVGDADNLEEEAEAQTIRAVKALAKKL